MKRILPIILIVALALIGATVLLIDREEPVVTSYSDYLAILSRDITYFESSELDDIGAYGFARCKKLTHIDLSGAEYTLIGANAFAGCYNLETAQFSTLMLVDNRAFDSCEKLYRVVFYDVAYGEPYVGDDVFAGTPIEDGEGYIYVPARRLEDAKALFWQYEDQVRAIEDGYLK